VADYNNGVVVKFVGGTGSAVMVGSGLANPMGVFVTRAGDVYVADTGNSAVVKFVGGTGSPVPVASGFTGPYTVFVTC
jgi:hypothetical protein